MSHNLLPEEDVLDDADDDGADPTLPGDVWFLSQSRTVAEAIPGRRGAGPIVYSRAFVPAPARSSAT